MPSIPGFWEGGPHEALPVEKTWRDFVRLIDGVLVEDMIREPRVFENADFFFPMAKVVAELKEIETEFASRAGFTEKLGVLIKRLVAEEPEWQAEVFGRTSYPPWFYPEFIRLFKAPISRILKKANRQIRETKNHLGVDQPTGVLLLVNDGDRNPCWRLSATC